MATKKEQNEYRRGIMENMVGHRGVASTRATAMTISFRAQFFVGANTIATACRPHAFGASPVCVYAAVKAHANRKQNVKWHNVTRRRPLTSYRNNALKWYVAASPPTRLREYGNA